MAAPKVGKWEGGKVGKWENGKGFSPVVGKGGGGVVASYQKEGALRASGMAEIEPTPPAR